MNNTHSWTLTGLKSDGRVDRKCTQTFGLWGTTGTSNWSRVSNNNVVGISFNCEFPAFFSLFLLHNYGSSNRWMAVFGSNGNFPTTQFKSCPQVIQTWEDPFSRRLADQHPECEKQNKRRMQNPSPSVQVQMKFAGTEENLFRLIRFLFKLPPIFPAKGSVFAGLPWTTLLTTHPESGTSDFLKASAST